MDVYFYYVAVTFANYHCKNVSLRLLKINFWQFLGKTRNLNFCHHISLMGYGVNNAEELVRSNSILYCRRTKLTEK